MGRMTELRSPRDRDYSLVRRRQRILVAWKSLFLLAKGTDQDTAGPEGLRKQEEGRGGARGNTVGGGWGRPWAVGVY